MLTSSQKKLFFLLSFLMGLVVILSNYLVQFPVRFYELENLLTYGAFSYPVTFLITDLANRAFGKKTSRYIVLVGFFIGIILLINNLKGISIINATINLTAKSPRAKVNQGTPVL